MAERQQDHEQVMMAPPFVEASPHCSYNNRLCNDVVVRCNVLLPDSINISHDAAGTASICLWGGLQRKNRAYHCDVKWRHVTDDCVE